MEQQLETLKRYLEAVRAPEALVYGNVVNAGLDALLEEIGKSSELEVFDVWKEVSDEDLVKMGTALAAAADRSNVLVVGPSHIAAFAAGWKGLGGYAEPEEWMREYWSGVDWSPSSRRDAGWWWGAVVNRSSGLVMVGRFDLGDIPHDLIEGRPESSFTNGLAARGLHSEDGAWEYLSIGNFSDDADLWHGVVLSRDGAVMAFMNDPHDFGSWSMTVARIPVDGAD